MNGLILLLNATVIGFLAFRVYASEKAGGTVLLNYFFPALLFKLVSGIAVGLLYQYFYQGSGDTFALFADGVRIFEVAENNLAEYFRFLFFANEGSITDFSVAVANTNDRALFFSKWISAVQFISLKNYWASGLYFSFFSFWGSWYSVKQLAVRFPAQKYFALIFFLFLPSVVLWGSGILKESLQMGCIGFLVGIMLKVGNAFKKMPPEKSQLNHQVFQFIIFLVLAYLLFQLKYYYAAILLPLLCLCLISDYNQGRKIIASKKAKIAFIAFAALGFFVVSNLHPNLSLSRVLHAIYLNHQIMVSQSKKPENLIVFDDFQPTLKSYLANAATAFSEGLGRPYLWEKGNWAKKIAAAERLGILFFILFCLGRFRLDDLRSMQMMGWINLSYCLILLVLLTFAAPNLGNLHRYQIGFMPFLLFQMSFLIKERKRNELSKYLDISN